MICLDTNYLILGLVPTSEESREIIAWTLAGEILVTSMTAWYEFLCGPVTSLQIAAIRAFLSDILPFDEPQAIAAAHLFNATGRKRGLRVDAMIAGAAMAAGASLATNNRTDFALFEPHGLKLV